MALEELRARIDQADTEIVALLAERMEIVKRVALEKARAGDEVFKPLREEQVLDRARALAGDQKSDYIAALYVKMMELSRAYQRALLGARTDNLYLVGMPGAGKTLIGRLAAERMGMPFCDVDEQIARRAGLDIPKIFEKFGEDAFRAMEKEALSELSLPGGRVIATGGGTILRDANRETMKRYGFVLYLTRPVALLETRGRPLSRSREALNKIFAARDPIYREISDARANNDKTPGDAARLVEEAFVSREPGGA